MRGTISLLVVPLLSGCGFLFTHGPPSGHEYMDYFTCTETETGPVLDWIWAGLNAAGLIAVAAEPDKYDYSSEAIAGSATWVVVSSAAALTGSRKVRRCREAKAALASRQAGVQPPAPGAAPGAAPGEVPVTPRPVTDRDRRLEAQYGVSAGERLVRTYSGGQADDVSEAVLRSLAGLGYEARPTQEEHGCFSGLDAQRGRDAVTVFICEAENPTSPALRWEITIVGPNANVVIELRRRVDLEIRRGP